MVGLFTLRTPVEVVTDNQAGLPERLHEYEVLQLPVPVHFPPVPSKSAKLALTVPTVVDGSSVLVIFNGLGLTEIVNGSVDVQLFVPIHEPFPESVTFNSPTGMLIVSVQLASSPVLDELL